MSQFLSPLITREDDNELTGLSTVEQPLRYYSALLKRIIEVPAGFVTDFASVPRLLGLYDLEGGKCNKAAVIHDFLYSMGSAYGGITRELADQVLREAILASGYSKLDAFMFYAAVRVGGASHWNADNLPQKSAVEASMLATATIMDAGA